MTIRKENNFCIHFLFKGEMKKKEYQAGCKATGIRIIKSIYIMDSKKEKLNHMDALKLGFSYNNVSSDRKVLFSFPRRLASCPINWEAMLKQVQYLYK